jgi:hypothetical protein
VAGTFYRYQTKGRLRCQWKIAIAAAGSRHAELLPQPAKMFTLQHPYTQAQKKSNFNHSDRDSSRASECQGIVTTDSSKRDFQRSSKHNNATLTVSIPRSIAE